MDIREIECAIVRAFITSALGAGCSITVMHAGVSRSRDEQTIFDATYSMDEDVLVVFDALGVKRGWVRFIYGNSGWDVIADSSANTFIDKLLEPAEAISDRYADEM